MKLYVDDIRKAPKGWLLARTIDEAVRMIVRWKPTDISLDHDIGNYDETFQSVAHLIGQMYMNDAFWADELEVSIHSDNPVGAKRLQDILEEYSIFAELKPHSMSQK